MRFAISASIVALATASLVAAAPVRRAASAGDLLVLTFADVLEKFETSFYTQALAKFQQSDFNSAGFSDAQVPIQQFTTIQADEQAHTDILQSTITSQGGTPITSCAFNVDSALTDVATMAATARVVENLGVAAYLGALHLMSDPVLATAAASIMTIEARHQSVLNIMNKATAIPQAFDIAFTPSEVLAVASPFISGCDLGVPANPTLSITNTGAVGPGTQLEFSSSAINGSTDGFSCQMLIGGAAFSIPLPIDQCIVPEGINGPVAIWITSDNQPLANNVRDRATDKVIAGPTMAFIDTQPDPLGQLARGGSTSTPATPATDAPTSTTTTTLTPAEASAILSSAGIPQPTTTSGNVNTATTPGTEAISVNGLSMVSVSP